MRTRTCQSVSFSADETAHNRNIIHLTTRAGRVVGTCGTTRSRTVRALGGFGEVATEPDQRGRGIATELCLRAVEEFREEGGEVLFLGTGNPAAARIYHRLGWRKLAGAQVMANVTSGASPEEFLVGWFAEPAPVAIEPASAAARVPIIPLMVSPHDWQVLDANAGMLSTRYAVQGSCMGLYRRYGYVIQDGRGAWFVAVAEDGRVVGQSTARLTGAGPLQRRRIRPPPLRRLVGGTDSSGRRLGCGQRSLGRHSAPIGGGRGEAGALRGAGFQGRGAGRRLRGRRPRGPGDRHDLGVASLPTPCSELDVWDRICRSLRLVLSSEQTDGGWTSLQDWRREPGLEAGDWDSDQCASPCRGRLAAR